MSCKIEIASHAVLTCRVKHHAGPSDIGLQQGEKAFKAAWELMELHAALLQLSTTVSLHSALPQVHIFRVMAPESVSCGQEADEEDAASCNEATLEVSRLT